MGLRGLGIARQIDAACLHHHRINETIGAVDVLRAGLGGLELAGQADVMTRVHHGDRRQPDGNRGQQRKDRVELGRNGQLRQLHLRVPRPVERPAAHSIGKILTSRLRY